MLLTQHNRLTIRCVLTFRLKTSATAEFSVGAQYKPQTIKCFFRRPFSPPHATQRQLSEGFCCLGCLSSMVSASRNYGNRSQGSQPSDAAVSLLRHICTGECICSRIHAHMYVCIYTYVYACKYVYALKLQGPAKSVPTRNLTPLTLKAFKLKVSNSSISS